jgi:hypothetical protein
VTQLRSDEPEAVLFDDVATGNDVLGDEHWLSQRFACGLRDDVALREG